MIAPYQSLMAKNGKALCLDQDQLSALVVLAQNGDVKAKDTLSLSQAPLCAKSAMFWGADAEEAFSVALMGVAIAINSYDLGSEASFTTWCALKIKGELSVWIRSKNQIKVPNNRRLAILKKERECLKNGIDPLSMMDKDEQYDYNCIKGAITSISTPIGDGKETLESVLATPEIEGMSADDAEVLGELLKCLSEEEKEFSMGVATHGVSAMAEKLGMRRASASKRHQANIDRLNRKLKAWAL